MQIPGVRGTQSEGAQSIEERNQGSFPMLGGAFLYVVKPQGPTQPSTIPMPRDRSEGCFMCYFEVDDVVHFTLSLFLCLSLGFMTLLWLIVLYSYTKMSLAFILTLGLSFCSLEF